jgi:hypothetical protein
MGRKFVEYVDSEAVYCCKQCHTHMVDRKNRISKVLLLPPHHLLAILGQNRQGLSFQRVGVTRIKEYLHLTRIGWRVSSLNIFC